MNSIFSADFEAPDHLRILLTTWTNAIGFCWNSVNIDKALMSSICFTKLINYWSKIAQQATENQQ